MRAQGRTFSFIICALRNTGANQADEGEDGAHSGALDWLRCDFSVSARPQLIANGRLRVTDCCHRPFDEQDGHLQSPGQR